MEKIGMKKEKKTTSNSFSLLVISPVIRGNYNANDQCYTKVQKIRTLSRKGFTTSSVAYVMMAGNV